MNNHRQRRAAPALPPAGHAVRMGFALCVLLGLAGCGGGYPPTTEPTSTSNQGTPVTNKAPTSVPAQPSIDVLSEPTGASIFLNGRLVGATPLKLPMLQPGSYSLRLERHGCEPRSMALLVSHEAQVVRAELPPQPTGSLDVAVEPHGAEVLLNGELVGVTPLKLDAVPIGIHEMTIRKTNYRPYTQIVRIDTGRNTRFADTKDHRLLKDLILEMLEGLTRSEPNRATHFLDKGHYLFINGRMDDAAEAFLDAEEVCARQPVFPADMTEGEREAELRLYSEDRRRVSREVARHRGLRSFDFTTAQQFNAAYEKAQQRRLVAKVDSWDWVQNKGRALLAEAQYLNAIQLYQAHLDHVRDGDTAVPCTIELMKVHLQMRDLTSFRTTFEKLASLAATRPGRLLEAIRAVQPYKDRLRSSQRLEFLSIVEQPLQQLLEKAEGAAKGEIATELAQLLAQQNRLADAIPFIELAIRNAGTEQEKEERSLQMAEMLRMGKRFDEARALYTRLSESERETVRKRAQAGLILLGVTKP